MIVPNAFFFSNASIYKYSLWYLLSQLQTCLLFYSLFKTKKKKTYYLSVPDIQLWLFVKLLVSVLLSLVYFSKPGLRQRGWGVLMSILSFQVVRYRSNLFMLSVSHKTYEKQWVFMSNSKSQSFETEENGYLIPPPPD